MCTRLSAVSYLWKAAGSPDPKNSAGFTDLPNSADCIKAVSWALEQGITDGTGPATFSPNQGCSRGQIVTFLYRQNVEPLTPPRVYTTNPSVNLTLTECNYLRVRESETSYSFSSTRVTFDKAWNDYSPHFVTDVTWTVDDPDILELQEMPSHDQNYWLEFSGKKPGSTRIVCHAVAEDGFTAEAYCYVTVLGANEPAPKPVPSFTPTFYGSPTDGYIAEVVRLVNIERAKVGAEPLGTFQRLTDAAQIRASELMKRFDITHKRPDGSSFDTVMKEVGITHIASYFGENAAEGQQTPAEVVDAWMNSPGHRANILNPKYTYIGVGYYY